MDITVPALISLARAIGNDPVVTLGNKRIFRVRVLEQDAGLEFTPESTNFKRHVAIPEINAVLLAYHKSNSLKRSDYTGVSFNASYLLALIKHYTNQEVTHGALSAEKLDAQFQSGLKHAQAISGAELAKRVKAYPEQPQQVLVARSAFLRNPYVVATVLQRAAGLCEGCGKQAPFLRAKDGTPYLEVHHVVQLAKGGKDTVDNARALCPNCHREAHFGAAGV